MELLSFLNEESIIDNRLQLCYKLCQAVSYRRKYLRNENFCNENFISPLAGSRGNTQTVRATLRTIMAGVISNEIEQKYHDRISNIVSQDPTYEDLRRIKAEDIITLGTVYFFLGNKFKVMFSIEPLRGG